MVYSSGGTTFVKRFKLKGNKLHLLQFRQICIETYTRSHQVATKTACRATLTQMLSSVCHRLQDSLASRVVRKSVRELWGAYHLTKKSGWGVESIIMVSDLPVYVNLDPRRNREIGKW